MLEDAGHLDVLINNAGIGWNATVEDVDIDSAKVVFETNYWGVIRCIQAVLPGMREQQSELISKRFAATFAPSDRPK